MTGTSFRLNASSAALRLLADIDTEEALAALALSRERYGWRLEPGTPPDEAAVLQWAKDHIDHDVLILQGWSTPTALTGAIPVRADDASHLAVAISTSQPADIDGLRLLLHQTRRQVEDILHPDTRHITTTNPTREEKSHA